MAGCLLTLESIHKNVILETWEQYRDKFKRISIDKMLTDIFSITRVQDEVIRLNQEQLQAGIDSQDKKINTIGGSPYRPYTVKIKEKEGQPTDRVTLFDTGEFYNSFNVKKVSGGWDIFAQFEKDDGDIRDNLPGEFDVLGLTGESLAELVYETILPRLEKMIKENVQ